MNHQSVTNLRTIPAHFGIYYSKLVKLCTTLRVNMIKLNIRKLETNICLMMDYQDKRADH